MSRLSPTVLWAQRADVIYLTVQLTDIKNEKITLDEKKLLFFSQGKDGTDYAFESEFHKDIVPKESKLSVTARQAQFVIHKKQVEGYWPRLTKGTGKVCLSLFFPSFAGAHQI